MVVILSPVSIVYPIKVEHKLKCFLAHFFPSTTSLSLPHPTSPSFESAVAAAVTGAVLDTGSVATVVLTRNPSATPTVAPVATAVVANVATSTSSKKDGDGVSLSSLSLLSLAVGVAVILLLCGAGVYCGVYRRGKVSECHPGRVDSPRDSTSLNGDRDPKLPKKGAGVDDEQDSRAFFQL